jgi:hypothetical protein
MTSPERFQIKETDLRIKACGQGDNKFACAALEAIFNQYSETSVKQIVYDLKNYNRLNIQNVFKDLVSILQNVYVLSTVFFYFFIFN